MVYFVMQGSKTAPNDDTTPVTPTPVVTGNAADLVSFSVAPGAHVSGVMTVNGSVKNAYFFEANIIVNILDANQNVLRTGHGTATTDWMTVDPVSFTANLDFTGLATGPGFIEIHNDNASALPQNDKHILVPVSIN